MIKFNPEQTHQELFINVHHAMALDVPSVK